MEKIIKMMCFILCILLINVGISFAKEEDDIYNTNKECDVNTKAKLISEARSVSVDYEKVTKSTYVEFDEQIDDESYDLDDYLNLKIYNVSPNIALKVTNKTTNRDVTSGSSSTLTYRNMRDGVITVEKKLNSYVSNYEITIYGLNNCTREKLRTINYTLPAYNPYSDLMVCQDVPEFYLCQPLITSTLPKNIDIVSAVEEYRADLEKQGLRKEEKEKSNTPTISKVVSETSKKKIGFVIVLLSIGVGITAFILFRRKKGAK